MGAGLSPQPFPPVYQSSSSMNQEPPLLKPMKKNNKGKDFRLVLLSVFLSEDCKTIDDFNKLQGCRRAKINFDLKVSTKFYKIVFNDST